MKISDQPWRVLLVDDHPLLRDGLRIALRRALPQARIAEAGTGEEALKLATAHRPQLMLLDVHLPGINGLELARRFRAADPAVRLLMVAGDADPWTVREALRAGASGFLSKTRAVEVLEQAVADVLEGRQYLCPESQISLAQAGAAQAHAGPEPGPAILSDRERQILRGLACGENTKGLALQLDISPKTVETHRVNLMRKLGIDSVAALTRYAIRHGLTAP